MNQEHVAYKMKNNLDPRQYIYVNNEFLSTKETSTLLKDIESKGAYQKHNFSSYTLNSEGTVKEGFEEANDRDPAVSFKGAITSNDLLMHKIRPELSKYIQYIDTPHLTGWMGYTSIKFIKYTEGTEMRAHVDHISSIFEGGNKGVPILTVVVLLQEGVKGGELILRGEKVPIRAGGIAIFPANVLYPHEVSMVEDGTRHTAICWVF